MSKRESTGRLILIVNKLRKKASSFTEIYDYLDEESDLQEYNFRVSKRTFQRDLEDIRSLYNIDIQYNFSSKVYYIDSEENGSMTERMLEAFDTFNALNVSDRIAQFIHFEKRRPKGTENLYGLVHAIKNKKCISFAYAKFWDDFSTTRTIEPYALKEFSNRWYIIGKDLNDENTKTFALDRLTNLQISASNFKLPINFDAEDHFRYCFGIISPNGQAPQKIVLSFEAHQGKYIKTLPLHDTQRVLLDTKEELQIELKLCITHDFVMELLSYGSTLKVLEPQSLIQAMKNELQSALNAYQ
jgi:predicted DNA-binding transcriptional regulator YafY